MKASDFTAFDRLRFHSKYVKAGDGECWPWTAGHIRGRGKFYHAGKDLLAPRVALTLAGLECPSAGAMACHSCDNPECVNPAHLWWGTAADNLADARGKGRLGGHRKASERQCRNGHARTPPNTRLTRTGALVCRVCAAERQARWKKRQQPGPSGIAQTTSGDTP